MGNAVVRRAAYGLAASVFAIGVAVALRNAPPGILSIELVPALVVGLVGAPLQVIVGGLLLRLMTKPVGHTPSLLSASRVAGIGTLSSVFPVSSGTVVRGAALGLWGVPPRTVIGSLLVDAAVWTAVALALSGTALVGIGVHGFGLACIGAAILAGAPSVGLAALRQGLGYAGGLILLRAATIVVDLGRLVMCFGALSYPITIGQGAVLAAAAPVSSLLFFLPGGLGVRELATAGFARAAGLEPSAAFLAATLNRVLGLVTLLVLELLLSRISSAALTPTGQAEEGDATLESWPSVETDDYKHARKRLDPER